MKITTDKQLIGTFVSQFKQMQAVHEIVSGDMQMLYDELKACTDMGRMHCLLRSFVRTLFAMTEGNAWNMKQLALVAPVPGLTFTEDELEKLTERRRTIKANGTIKESIRFLQTLENLEFGFEIMAKVFEVESALDTADGRCAAMERANSRRNRMVHPKTADDLTMDTPDLESLVEGFQWYLNAFSVMNDRCALSLNTAMREQSII